MGGVLGTIFKDFFTNWFQKWSLSLRVLTQCTSTFVADCEAANKFTIPVHAIPNLNLKMSGVYSISWNCDFQKNYSRLYQANLCGTCMNRVNFNINISYRYISTVLFTASAPGLSNTSHCNKQTFIIYSMGWKFYVI